MIDTAETREAWLRSAIDIFRPRMIEIGAPLPEKVRVSVGFGATGARQENSVILGVTFAKVCTVDGVNEVFISPEDADTASMLATLLHELIHVALDCEDGHKGRFAEAFTRLGFTGSTLCTNPSIDLAVEIMTIAATLGEYPGAKLDLKGAMDRMPVGPDGQPIVAGPTHSAPKKQGTRMLKVVDINADCAMVGYTVRTTAKWLAVGVPRCPLGCEMVAE